MRVAHGVGLAVMIAVMGGPPERAPLDAGGAERRECELHTPGGPEGAVREAAVIERGEGKHTQRIEHPGERQRHGRDPRGDRPQTAEVQGDKRRGAQPINSVRPRRLERFARGLRIEPVPYSLQVSASLFIRFVGRELYVSREAKDAGRSGLGSR